MSWQDVNPATRRLLEQTCTPKQLEVLKLAAHGLSQRQIARHLSLSRSTVRTHIESALDRAARAKEGT